MKNGKRIVRVGVRRLNDPNPDVSYLEQEGFEERLAALQRGEFGFIGIRATAELVVEGVCQTIHSGGLWGIESDSEESYLQEVEGEELAELLGQLRALGFGTRAVGKAFKELERRGD